MLRYILTMIALSCSYAAFAQSSAPAVNDMYLPNSPGFVLLDKAPASIEKPTSPKTFGISIFNALRNNEGAMDVTPYWLFNHPARDFAKSIDNKAPVLQTLNLSAAGAQNDTGTFLSAGLRCHVLRLYAPGKRANIEAKYKKLEALLSELPEDLDEEAIREAGKELTAARSEATFSVELAAAMAGYSSTNRFSQMSNYRYGAWLNLRWQPYLKTPVSVVGVARFTRAPGGTEVSLSDSAFLDLGLGLSYANERFDLQLEYVRRQDITNNDTYERTALVGNYRVAENLFIVGTLGKNFSNLQDVLILFGVKFGISREKIGLRPASQQ